MPDTHSVSLCGRSLDQPGHICAFFNSREQEYDVLTPYFAEGLEGGEQVINIVDAGRHADHCSRLRARGIAVDDAMAADQLKVLTAEDTYAKGGRFGAERMFNLLQGALATAKQSDRRVRTSGVMDWATRGYAGTEELMEYEAKVNVLVPIFDCTLLCVYDLSQISGQMVMDILTTHPYVIYGRRVLQNSYYVPPIDVLRQVLLGGTSPSASSQVHPA